MGADGEACLHGGVVKAEIESVALLTSGVVNSTLSRDAWIRIWCIKMTPECLAAVLSFTTVENKADCSIKRYVQVIY